MRTSAFPSFRKLYGRILVEENTKLADKMASESNNNNKTSRFHRLKSELLAMFNETNPFGGGGGGLGTKKTVSKYRLPRGQYYVEIDYSK